ncbi:MAG: radical SAM protein [Candidatus Nezhaarchaeales archaeon]
MTEVRCRSALSKSGIYGVDYSLNPYFGCEHACVYCYVPRMMPGRLRGRAWGEFVEVKANVAEVLARELRRAGRGVVLVSSVTDPYQPVERRYELTRRCVELLSSSRLEVTVLTKSALFKRDLDSMDRRRFEVGVTVTTIRAHRELEPLSDPPAARLEALREASREGLRTFLFLGPLIPGVVDGEVEEIIEMAYSAGAGRVVVDRLNARGDVVQSVAKALGEGLLREFISAVSKRGWLRSARERVAKACERFRLPCDFCF